MHVALRPAVRPPEQPPPLRDEAAAAALTGEAVIGVHEAARLMGRTLPLRVAMQPAEWAAGVCEGHPAVLASGIGRVLATPQHVRVALHAAAGCEDPKRRNKSFTTELATEAVCWVHLTHDGVGIPGVRVGEELPAEAPVGQVLPAAYFMGVSQRLPVGCHKAHDPVFRDKQLLAVPTSKPVRGILLARPGVLVPGGRIGELPATKAAVPGVRLAAVLVGIP
mmetsp:Transcript_89960/g.284800  ORF Transcript_89960/g.284800 Transcript_89960/m.284800 type:complete len:222 (-) Transcript_89960:490-1155(-)